LSQFRAKFYGTQHSMPALTSPKALKALIVPLIFGSLVMGPAARAAGTSPVNLRSAYFFVVLSETGITDVATSHVVGNVGTSPITGAADLLTCNQVRGKIYSVDATGPAPCSKARAATLGQAVLDMQTAYNDAAGRSPTVTELGAGNIGGMTLAPGVYSWSSSVTIPTNLTLKGGRNDVWIFQVAQNVDIASATSILLRGGVNPANVIWQVAGEVTIGTYAKFQGTILCMTQISMMTDATIHGRLYSQTAVTLQMNTVKQSLLPSTTISDSSPPSPMYRTIPN
jgi:hypothetical protein